MHGMIEMACRSLIPDAYGSASGSVDDDRGFYKQLLSSADMARAYLGIARIGA